MSIRKIKRSLAFTWSSYDPGLFHQYRYRRKDKYRKKPQKQ